MKFPRGFSLIEMAFVLVIVTLLLGGLLVPFSTQVEQRRIAETQKGMEEIKEALIGFAVANGRLPCPDTTGDGQEDACPIASTTSTGGNLPWVTLGTANADAWGRPFQYRVNGAFTTTFSLSTTGTANSGASGILRVCSDYTCTSLEASNVPAVIYSSGKNGAIQPPASADELENTTLPTNVKFDRTFVSRIMTDAGAPVGEFDDLVTWLSPNVLFNRMVAAGKLP
jgi:prepilin-type N-terminal cleavage/methylation domain-containing protein